MRFTLGIWFLLSLAPNVTAELPSWIELADRARWAANAHNVQSWRLEAVPGNTLQRQLVLDSRRLLPETDPPSRQLTISLGAFLAVLEDTAATRGAQIRWTPLPDRPGALVSLAPAETEPPLPSQLDALTSATVKYHTASLVISQSEITALEQRSTDDIHVRVVSQKDEVERGLEWARQAYRLEMNLPRTRDESIRYTIYGADHRKQTPWGITLVPNFPSSELFWVETAAQWFPQAPADYAKSAIQMFEKALEPVRQLVVITSKGDGNRERLETGEVLERVWLDVRSAGGELLPLSQGLEEFPEMADLYREAHGLWASPGETVQMVLAVFRPGPGSMERSPRLAAREIVSDSDR